MPKYEDFKVGDTWICRDCGEAIVTSVNDNANGFCIHSTRAGDIQSHTARGGVWERGEYDRDLIHKKETHGLDLTKPLRFKVNPLYTHQFRIEDLENVPEPVTRTVKRWALVEKEDGRCYYDHYTTRESAEEACEDYQIVVELTGEYTV